MKTLRNWLTPPVFEDEVKTEQAYLLHVIVWALICVPIPFLIYSLVFAPETAIRAIVQSVFGETVNIVLLVMLRRGYVRAASIAQVSAFWFFFTASAATSFGVQGEPYLLGYTLVIAIAGMLLGVKGAIVFTILSLVSGAGMVYGSAQGWIVPGFENSALSTWVVSLVLFPVGALLQHLGMRTVRKALARARASEEKYRLISSVSSDYTFSTELDQAGNMRLNWVAGAFEAMTGYTHAEYTARGGWYAHLHPEDAGKDAEALARLMVNQRIVHELRTYTKTGELQWVRVYAHPVWDEREDRLVGIVGAVQDITKRKQAEEALKAERDLLQLFMDNIPDTVYFKDRTSRFVRVNLAQAKFLNLDDPQDAMGKTDLDFQPPELATHFIEEESRLLQTGQSILNRIEFNPTADGSPRWLSATKVPLRDSEGQVIGILGISRDVTQQQLAETRETQRRAALEKVISLSQHVAEVQDLRTALQRIWNSVHHGLGFDRVGIYLYNPELNAMDGTYGTNNQGEMIDEWGARVHLDDTTVETVAFKTTLQDVNGLYFTRNYDTEYEIPPDHIMAGVKDHAAVAAWTGEKPVAVICVDNVITGRAITEEQLETLRLFAGYAGLAISNARLNDALGTELAQQKRAEEQEARRRAMLEKVVGLGKLVTEVSDLRTTLERIWHGVHDELGFDRLAIFLYDQDNHSVRGTLGTDNRGEIVEEWDYERSLNQQKPTSFTRALEQPDGVFLSHNFDVEHNISEDHEMYGVKDFATVTAWGGRKPVAIITVDNLPSKRPFTREQIEALRLFSGYAGLAIENARLNSALEEDLKYRKQLIDELEARNAELERFTYTVSHDLKSPLVTITGFLGFLEKDALAGNTQRVKSNINRISSAAEKMESLLNDLLELSRIGRLMNPPENVPFVEIVHEAVDRVRGPLDEIDALVEIQTEMPVVHGDRIRLVEVVQNLIENAVKYSNPKTRTRIEIGAQEYPQNGAVFFVRDNGIGIAREYHETIFGLFNKLNPAIEGTGIGLTLVKRIIEVHGGRIWVESEPGKGAIFHFTIPTQPVKE